MLPLGYRGALICYSRLNINVPDRYRSPIMSIFGFDAPGRLLPPAPLESCGFSTLPAVRVATGVGE